jgi:hypothetical protein
MYLPAGTWGLRQGPYLTFQACLSCRVKLCPKKKGAGEMVQQVQASGALGEGLGLVLSTIPSNPSFWGSDALFWPSQHHMHGADTDRRAQLHNKWVSLLFLSSELFCNGWIGTDCILLWANASELWNSALKLCLPISKGTAIRAPWLTTCWQAVHFTLHMLIYSLRRPQ